MPPPVQVDNIFVFIRQVAVLLRHVGYLRHQQQVDLLTLKVVSKSHVTWATSVPILVFLGLSVLELGPMYMMYATDRCQTDRRQTKASLNASTLWGQRHNNHNIVACITVYMCSPESDWYKIS